MKRLSTLLLILGIILSVEGLRAQKYEELAKTPQMGWNSWNKFACDINEELIREIADAMIEKGIADAGYVYINLDDCWHASERDADGFIQCDAERFPSGIKALADYVHERGLKLGIYSDAGTHTCGGRLGSLGHEYQDALQYARWGIDYLKYDWCSTDNINAKGAYTLMSNALRAAGRPILFSMCEWGTAKPWEWAKDIAHSWRTTGDIWLSFDQVQDLGTWKAWSVMHILDMNADLRRYAGPGHWNDPDMLEVGNGLTQSEDRAHFTMWCMLSAPLILGNDIRTVSDQTLDIILNRCVIAIDQDPLGVQGYRFLDEGDFEVWLKPLAGGDWAFCMLNRGSEPKQYTIEWANFDWTDDEVSGLSTELSTKLYNIENLWKEGKEANEGTTKRSKSVTIPSHDVVLYRLSPVTKKRQ
ncbi:MAG: glycoside hydrolase family 27 protein [Alistipes sp.]|nr:glycoside hydrolase family 27 protein [Alistipes sp.]